MIPGPANTTELSANRQTLKATLNDGSWDFRSPKLAEGNQYVSFEFTVTDSEPVRITSYRAGSPYSMFNAIQMVPLGKSPARRPR